MQSSGFEWLLATASHGDLLATEKLNSHSLNRNRDFRAVIKQTLSSTRPEKTRLSVIGPKAKAVKQVFMKDIGSVLVPETVIDIIGSYVTEDFGDDNRKLTSEKLLELGYILDLMHGEERAGKRSGKAERDQDREQSYEQIQDQIWPQEEEIAQVQEMGQTQAVVQSQVVGQAVTDVQPRHQRRGRERG